MRIEEGFRQAPPPEGNPFTTDLVLPGLVRRLLPAVMRAEVEKDLTRLGAELMGPIRQMSDTVHNAKLVQYDHWGRRVDNLQTSEGWRYLKQFAAKEGFIGIPYSRQYGPYGRIYGFLKIILAIGDTHVIMCPGSMTDGAARAIELFGSPEMKKQILPRLISRDSEMAYTSGQWMTERPGGSDVSQTETTATADESATSPFGKVYTLDGFKWFSSATDAEMSLALARTGSIGDGSRGLSLFLVPMRFSSHGGPGSALENGILMHRLKDKLGTHGVPTAELSLNQTKAWLLGPVNMGVKCIVPVLNITRVHSAIHSIGSLQRCLAIARAYSTVRRVQGGTTLLQDVPLHVAPLAQVSLLYRALTNLTFGAIVLLGKSECGVSTEEEEARLRMLTPTVKAFAAEQAPTAMEECMAALGGQGYMEETGIARLIRDSLVEKIWEGTINIMALDLARATRDHRAVTFFVNWAIEIIHTTPRNLTEGILAQSLHILHQALEKLPIVFKAPMNPLLPRSALLLFGHVASSVYLLEHAIWSANNGEYTADGDVEAVRRWIEEGAIHRALIEVDRLIVQVDERVASDRILLYGSHADTVDTRQAQSLSGEGDSATSVPVSPVSSLKARM